jgi:hypothetical protein
MAFYTPSHSDLARHRKTKRFMRALDLGTVAAVGHLHLFWHWVLEFAPSGDISYDRFTCEDIADGAMWEGDALPFLEALVTSGFVDRDGERLSVHDWDSYGGEYQKKLAKDRERKRAKAKSTEGDGVPTDIQEPSTGFPRNATEIPQRERETKEKEKEEIPPVAIATSPKGGKRTPRILVADFQPSEEQVEQAIGYGVPPEQIAFETEKWRDYHAAKGDVVKDAPASWRTWMRNAVTYAAKDRASPSGRASPVTFAQQRQKNNDAAFDAVFSKLREQEANGNGTYRTGDQEIDRGIPGRDDTGEYRRLPHRVPEH